MILKALPLVHFWSVLLLKEQMMTSVRKTLKTLVWSAQNQSIFSEFCPKNNQKIRHFFYQLLSGQVSPENSHEIPAKLADFFRNFVPKNPAKFDFFSTTYQKPWILESFNGPFSSSLSDFIIILIIISDNPTPCSIIKNFNSNQKVFLEEFRPCQENIFYVTVSLVLTAPYAVNNGITLIWPRTKSEKCTYLHV